MYLTNSFGKSDRLLGTPNHAEQAAGTYARKILDRLLIDLSWNSSRLEGNTYSLLETKRLIEQGRAAEGKERGETQMILNHKDAIEFLVDGAEEIGFNRHTILNLHGLLANNLLGDPDAVGRLRLAPVAAGFREIVERDLMGMHEGNFARYWIRPSEFTAWQAVWNRG